MTNILMDYTNESVINAYGYLLEYLSSRRFGIIDRDDIVNKLEQFDVADKIVSDLNLKYDINLYGIKEKSKIEKYELILNNDLVKYTKENLSYSGIDDEVKLIRNSKLVDKGFFEDKEIAIGSCFQEKKYFQALGISRNTLKKLCKEPSYIHKINTNSLEFYKITKAFKYKGRQERLLLADIFKDKGGYYIFSALISRKQNFFYFLDNPVRMFLLFLDKYGLDVQLDGYTKRYFYKFEMPINGLLSPPEPKVFYKRDSKPRSSKFFCLALNVKKWKDKFHYANVYALDLTQYRKDLKGAFI